MPQLALSLIWGLLKGNKFTEAEHNRPGKRNRQTDFVPDLDNRMILAFLKRGGKQTCL